jgi:hypothetical protein
MPARVPLMEIIDPYILSGNDTCQIIVQRPRREGMYMLPMYVRCIEIPSVTGAEGCSEMCQEYPQQQYRNDAKQGPPITLYHTTNSHIPLTGLFLSRPWRKRYVLVCNIISCMVLAGKPQDR